MLSEGSDKKPDGSRGDSAEAMVPAAITDTGCERDLNEDRYAVIESKSGLAWIVCDGMGGVTGGELAAQLAIDAMRRDLENLPARPCEGALRSALVESNRIIVLRRQNQAFSQMGTTVVGAIFDGPEVVVGHVGDSRAYLVRDGAIQQLTVDHTYVQELVDRGEIQPEEALSHPKAHILTRCIGSEPGLEVELRKYWIWQVQDGEPTDALILCTDGLYSLVADGEVASIVSQMSPQQACVELVELAKARGGYDNITVAIIPLGGQMKQDPPLGYEENQRRKPRRGDDEDEAPGSSMSNIRFMLIVAFVAVISAVAMVLGFLKFGF